MTCASIALAWPLAPVGWQAGGQQHQQHQQRTAEDSRGNRELRASCTNPARSMIVLLVGSPLQSVPATGLAEPLCHPSHSLHLCQCQLGCASCPVETMATWFPPIPVPRATVAASRQSRQPWRWHRVPEATTSLDNLDILSFPSTVVQRYQSKGKQRVAAASSSSSKHKPGACRKARPIRLTHSPDTLLSPLLRLVGMVWWRLDCFGKICVFPQI